MKKLSELYNIESDVLVKDIKINSKEVSQGDIFVCTMGVTADRHDFIDEAIKNGASSIVVSRDVGEKDVPIIRVENTNKELIFLARKLYDFIDDKLSLIGVTGTNGKTTICTMIEQLLGDSCGYMGTNGIKSRSFNEKIRNTTPDADRLYKYFKKFTDDGCTILSMETSSESFFRHRLDTLKFKVGIMSNITEDHLNIHKTIENYVDSKMELLRNVREDGVSILNTDDEYYSIALENARGKILSFGKKDIATIKLVDTIDSGMGSIVTFIYEGTKYEVNSPFLGEVNAYNLLASILAVLSFGYTIDEILEKIPTLNTVPGRLDILYYKEYTVVLDYAHTTDAFKKVLPILNKLKQNRLVVVTGSAGGREKEKRPVMGKYILDNSDHVIFTMDDPRYESVLQIIDDLKREATTSNYEIIEDRESAIHSALDNAKVGDVILIAGKGVDDYMAIEDKYLPFSDLEVITSYLKEKGLV